MNSFENFFKKYNFKQANNIFEEIVSILGKNTKLWNDNSVTTYNRLKKNNDILLGKISDDFYIYNNKYTFDISIEYLKKIKIHKLNGDLITIWDCNSYYHIYIFKNYEEDLYIKKDKKYKLINEEEAIDSFEFYEYDNLENFIKEFNFPNDRFDINNINIKQNFPNGFKTIKELNIFIPTGKSEKIVFFHNIKIGMTYTILKKLMYERRYYGTRILYLNIHYLRKNPSLIKWKKYFYYYCSILFNYNELKLFKVLIRSIFKIINREFKIENIINFILLNFTGENIKIIFDNIDNKDSYNDIKRMKINEHNNNLKFNYIISLNDNSYEIFNKYLKNEYKEEFYFLQKKNIDELKLEDDFDNKYNEEELYRKRKTEEINDIIKEKRVYFIFSCLIILINLSSHEKIEDENDIDILNYIYPFLYYIYIQMDENNKITKIRFRNDVIKEIIYDSFIFSQTFHLLSDTNIHIDKILKKEEGIRLEKLIIYSLLLNKYTSYCFYKIKVKSIYCIDEIPIINYKNQNILFFQNNPNSEIYDFVILVIKDNKLFLKAYQIGINKNKSQLIKLNKDIIELDLSYFIHILEYKINKKISKYSFGIITNKKGLEDTINYPNFNIMKDYCINFGFEFLIFDTNNCDLSEYDKTSNTFIPIIKMSYINDCNNLNKLDLIKNGFPNKYPINKINQEKLINNINNILKENNKIKQDLNLNLVGMFNGIPSNFYLNSYLCYYHKITKNDGIHNISIFYNGKEILKKLEKENIIQNNYILFFKIIEVNKYNGNNFNTIKIKKKIIKKNETKNIICGKFKRKRFFEDEKESVNKKILSLNDQKVSSNKIINNHEKVNENLKKNKILISSDEEVYANVTKNNEVLIGSDEEIYTNEKRNKKRKK